MSTMEHLFMQIFERRDWIARQLRQQGESFSQSLASNLIAAGGVRPPWLWTAAAGSDFWDTRGRLELNKEQVISGTPPEKPAPSAGEPYDSMQIDPNRVNSGESGRISQKPIRPESLILPTLVETPIPVSNCFPGHNENQDTVMNSFDKVQNFSVVQTEKQVNLGKQRKLIGGLSKQRSAAEYTGRITRSRATSMKTCHVKESLNLKSLSKFQVEFDDKITHQHVISSNPKDAQTNLSAGDVLVRGPIVDKATATTTGACSQQLSNINLLRSPTGFGEDEVTGKFRRPNASHCSIQSEDAVCATSGSGYSKRRKVEHSQGNCSANSPALRISLHLDEDSNHSLKETSWVGVGTCEPFEQCQNDLNLERKEDRTSALLPQHMQKGSSHDCHVGGQADSDSPKSMDDLKINASTGMPLALKEFVTINGLEIIGPFEHCHGLEGVLEEISYSGPKNTLESFYQPEKPQAEENEFHVERKEDGMSTLFCQCMSEGNSLDYHVGQVDRDSPRSTDELEVNESNVLPLALNESTSVNCLENDESFQQCPVLKEVPKEIACPCHENPLEYFHQSGNPQGEESDFHLERKDSISTVFLPHTGEESSLDCHAGGQADRDTPRSMDGLKNSESTGSPRVSKQSVIADYLEVDESFELCHVLKEVEKENTCTSHQNPPKCLHQCDKLQEEENDFRWERKDDRTPTSLLQHVRDKSSPDCHVVDQADGDPSMSMDDLIYNKTTASPLVLKESDTLKDLETNESFDKCHILQEVEKEISCSCHERPPDCLDHEEKPQNDLHLERKEDRMSTSFIRHMQKTASRDCSVGGNMHGDSPKIINDFEDNGSTGQPLVLQEAVTVNDENSTPDIPNALTHVHLESTCIKQVLQNAQSQDETKCQVLLSPVRSSYSGQSDLAIPAEEMPELEGFSIGSPIMENDLFFDDPNLQKLTRERASALEQVHRSMNISTSISRFSTGHRIHRVPDVCQSFPSDLLKCISWDDHFQCSSTDGEGVGAANDGSLTHVHRKTAASFGSSLLEKSGPHSSPFSNAQLFTSVRKGPFTPPVEKFPHKVLTESKGWSTDRIVSNPELTCFRIDENVRSPEESGCKEECQDTSKERFGSRGRGFSSNRSPLGDVTSIYQNAAAIGSTAKKNIDPIIAGSLETKFSFSTEMNDKKNLENGCGSHTISKVQNKKNGFLSASRNNVQTVAASLQNRRSKVSLKADEQKRSQATLERKDSNIVSNISSFVPLVRQKQQPTAPITGKRDIKVKALEVAEAAKRQAEKKENERKRRKEAARLERMRLEHENARQLELKQKQNEEEKKKKEADIAARKRQREKEEREEKQRKKNCIEGARQRKAHEDRVRVEEKDLQLKEDKEQKKKTLTKEAGILHKTEKVHKIARVVTSIEMGQDRTNIAGDARNVSNSLQSCEAPDNSKTSYKVNGSSSELEQAMHDRNVTLKENPQAQSYVISPYRDSDDEGEDDKRPKKKFVPSWARRESLDEHLFSMRHLDPRKIFSRKRSFDLSEVLSFRTRQRTF